MFQFSLDRTDLRECLAELYGIPPSEVNATHLNMSGIRLGEEVNICTGGGYTTHFPEVSLQDSMV